MQQKFLLCDPATDNRYENQIILDDVTFDQTYSKFKNMYSKNMII